MLRGKHGPIMVESPSGNGVGGSGISKEILQNQLHIREESAPMQVVGRQTALALGLAFYYDRGC
jgi:hypothetical protein